MAFISNIESFFKQKSILSNLIAINILVFLVTKIVGVLLLLFNKDPDALVFYLELPSYVPELIRRPWTIITYMFAHDGLLHILFNLLWLYWFGQIFLRNFLPKQLGGLYFLGGIAGGALYVLAYNIFPYFEELLSRSFLLGASAAVMAVVFGIAFYRKDLEIRLLFLGNIKIIYIAWFTLVLDLISIPTGNPGGHIAHIGGALMGICYAEAARRGRDITAPANALIDWVVGLFVKKPKPIKVTSKRQAKGESDWDYNARKQNESAEIDKILEKIKRSGYDSLSETEKRRLFDASKK